jgi:GT2 family glycosyltransferase
MSLITFCISTFNNLEYLKLAVESVRKNSYFKDAPFIVHAENCDDGTDEWLDAYHQDYNLDYYIEKNPEPVGIGGGMNFCAKKVQTEYIMFLHSDFYVSKNWDKACLDIFEKYPDKKLWVSSHRIEPQMFSNSQTRPGTVIAPKDYLGAYWNDFNKEGFELWAEQFVQMNDFEIPKGEGVSGLIRKKDWDAIGGNDPIFAPASWDDMDLFLRMLQAGYEFILTSKSLVWHFGARGSHRLEENNGQTSQRQKEAEAKNQQKWLAKWGKFPIFNEYGMVKS